MRPPKPVIVFALLALILSTTFINALAAVDLMYFLGESGEGQVLLKWETASELNNAGYYVTRSLDNAGSYQRISGFLPAQGDGITGAYYEYPDLDVIVGTHYFYVLEIVDISGISDFTDPISVLYGVPTSTPTPTLTRTPAVILTGSATATPTVTLTQTPPPQGETSTATATVTRTATRVRIPTSTATQFRFQPTNTSRPGFTLTIPPGITLTPTILFTERPTPTKTLLPLPTLILLFPENFITLTPTLTRTPKAALAFSQATVPTPESLINPQLGILGGVIVLIWLLMGGLLVYMLRRIG